MELNKNKLILVAYAIGFLMVSIDAYLKVFYNDPIGVLAVGTILTILCPILLIVVNYKKIARFLNL